MIPQVTIHHTKVPKTQPISVKMVRYMAASLPRMMARGIKVILTTMRQSHVAQMAWHSKIIKTTQTIQSLLVGITSTPMGSQSSHQSQNKTVSQTSTEDSLSSPRIRVAI